MPELIITVAADTRLTAVLRPSELNPRGPVDPATVTDLAASIREHGILQPLLITPDLQVIAGHRRLAAAILVGLTRVPVVVREMDEATQLAAMLTENIQRADLSPLQEARGYLALKAHRLTNAEIARRCGISHQRVSEYLLLLDIDPLAQDLFDRRELPLTALRPLAKIADLARQRRLASLVATRAMTVFDVERLLREEAGALAAPPPPIVKPEPRAPQTASRREALAAIAEHRGGSITVRALGEAVEGICSVCDQCGCKDIEVICAACPLPRLILRLLR